MDFIGGALPNVIFLVGVIVLGAALGIQFKLVEVQTQFSKNGRVGAFIVGGLLIATSIYLHVNPQDAATDTAASEAAPAEAAPAETAAPTDVPPTDVPPTDVPPTDVPPTETATTSTRNTAIISVPDVRDEKRDKAQERLEDAGLQPIRQDTSCAAIDASTDMIVYDAKRDHVMCQSPAPGTMVEPNTPVIYVLGEDGATEAATSGGSTGASTVAVPDVRDERNNKAQEELEDAGLQPIRQDTSCAAIDASADMILDDAKKDHVMCQSPAPGTMVEPNTPVLYVLQER